MKIAIVLAGTLTVAAFASGCAQPARQAIYASPPPAPQASVKRISNDGTGGLLLPDGSRVQVDRSGGFVLPNGEYVRRDSAGALNLPNGARCLPDRAGGFVCP